MVQAVTASAEFSEIRHAVRQLCARFAPEYFRRLDQERGYPEEFVQALTADGWLAALIPSQYGGSGLGLAATSVILEEINRSGANAAACHGQFYSVPILVKHATYDQRSKYLPKIASGELRLQSVAITESRAGTDTAAIETTAVRRGAHYVVNGQKMWISRVHHSDAMLLLARTTPLAEVHKRSDGLSLFIVDLRQALGKTVTAQPIRVMMNHDSNEISINGLEIPAADLIGDEGRGFRYVLDGLNAERALIAAECVGDGRWFIDRGVDYAGQRSVFGRAIGANQGVQFPIARAHTNVEAASLMRFKACELYDAGQACGAEANMAKLLAADASREAGRMCMELHGGFGFAVEFDIERKFRETSLYQVAPISTNMILSYLAQHVLGLPRSF
jgi:acyl-CoA dehydrogenase